MPYIHYKKISLALRAEKTNPFYLTYLTENTKYLRCQNLSVRILSVENPPSLHVCLGRGIFFLRHIKPFDLLKGLPKDLFVSPFLATQGHRFSAILHSLSHSPLRGPAPASCQPAIDALSGVFCFPPRETPMAGAQKSPLLEHKLSGRACTG